MVTGHGDKETMFKIKKTTIMGTVFNAYAARKGVDRAALRFMLDGELAVDDLTPESSGLEDDDQIDALCPQLGCKKKE